MPSPVALSASSSTTARARLTYRQAAQPGFWLKEGQRVEITGEVRDSILHIATLVWITIQHHTAIPVPSN